MDKCNHENMVYSSGFVVCGECGLCVDIIHDLTSNYSELDHRIMTPKSSTMLGFRHERNGIYHRIAKPRYRVFHRDTQKDILTKLKSLLAALHHSPDLYKSLYPYMINVHRNLKPRTNLRGINLFVSCITYVCLKEMNIAVSLEDISEVSGIKLRN